MSEINSVTMRIYHPNASGYATATFAFVDGQLPLASELESMIIGRGWLLEQPGLEAGEDAESILYVCRQNHENDDGTVTPKISFYSENEHLVMRWLGNYLNTPEEIADFDAATGLQVDKIPVWTDSIPPKRTDKKAQNFIVKLAKPIRVVRETYTNKDGDPRHKFVRFVDYIGNKPQSADNTLTPEFGKPNQADGAVAETMRQANNEPPPTQGNKPAISKELIDATKFMYEPDYVYQRHINSLEKHLQSGKVTPEMKIGQAVFEILKHRALTDLFLDSNDYYNIFKMAIETYVQGNGLIKTWERMNDYYQAQQKPAKASGQ